MSKSITLTTITSGFYSTQALNANFDEIVTYLQNVLSLDGDTPNTMGADLDMDGNSILNALIELNTYTVATVPAATPAGQMAYVSDGDGGVPCLAVSNGSDWLRVALGSAVSAS